MKRAIIFSLLFCFVLVLSYCTKEKKKDAEVCLADDPNPNKSSELAVLMRKMAKHAEETKAQVLAGKLTGSFPEEFLKIQTAVPTDSTIKGETFDLFASVYLKNLELLYSSSEELNVRYNAVVNTCVSCHENSCPGPLVRINKLKI